MILDYVPEAPKRGGDRRGHSLPSRQYSPNTSSLLTLSLNLFIKHSSSVTRLQFKECFLVTSLGLLD